MGHLGQPLNTFWQLFRLPATSSRWKLDTPPGVASNGGLVASAAGPGAVLAGFLPSLDLHFSPVAASTDQGGTWSTGVLPGALAQVPDSLASDAGQDLALLRGGSNGAGLDGSGGVVSATGDLTAWNAVVSNHALAADPSTSGCGIEHLTAVAFGTGVADSAGRVGDDALIGAECAHGRRAGVFVDGATGWVMVGPVLPGVAAGPTEVLRLVDSPAGVSALVSTGTGTRARLFALWGTGTPAGWTVAAPLPLGGAALISTGVTASGGFVIAARGTDDRRMAAVVEPSAGSWKVLAPPPAGTGSVIATPVGTFDAFVPDQSTLDVDTLGGDGWLRTQSIDVNIQYGSSG
jgi:hypothetical protein